jgi:predicted acyltransferase
LLSVDALRGFDMFWIIGGEAVAHALEKVSGGVIVSTIATQLTHAEWVGFHFFDAIFPLFLFLVGVSIVLSLDRVMATAGRRAAIIRIARRSLLLFGVGVFYYGGIERAWPDVQLSGVLPRIAICYFIAATLYIFLPRKGIVAVTALCLVGYWAMLTYIPFPDVHLMHSAGGKKATQAAAKIPAVVLDHVSKTAKGTFEEGHNLANYVDFRWLPGKKRNLYYSNEGLLSTIPAVATTLFGVMAGWVLTNMSWSGRQKVGWLVAGGSIAVVLGLLWGLKFPIIKRIWTSSFCLLASGCAAMTLGVFYLVVDVWRWQKWCLPFLWIGANALAVYLAASLLDFQEIASRFVGGNAKFYLDAHVAQGIGGLVIAILGLMLPVLLVRFLYQRKVFIRL